MFMFVTISAISENSKDSRIACASHEHDYAKLHLVGVHWAHFIQAKEQDPVVKHYPVLLNRGDLVSE